MNHSTQGLPVHNQLLESTQTHVHRVSDKTFLLIKKFSCPFTINPTKPVPQLTTGKFAFNRLALPILKFQMKYAKYDSDFHYPVVAVLANVHLFYCLFTFHRVNVPQLAYAYTWHCTFGLFPVLGSYELRWCEYRVQPLLWTNTCIYFGYLQEV